jgi:hypothetical protein
MLAARSSSAAPPSEVASTAAPINSADTAAQVDTGHPAAAAFREPSRA